MKKTFKLFLVAILISVSMSTNHAWANESADDSIDLSDLDLGTADIVNISTEDSNITNSFLSTPYGSPVMNTCVKIYGDQLIDISKSNTPFKTLVNTAIKALCPNESKDYSNKYKISIDFKNDTGDCELDTLNNVKPICTQKIGELQKSKENLQKCATAKKTKLTVAQCISIDHLINSYGRVWKSDQIKSVGSDGNKDKLDVQKDANGKVAIKTSTAINCVSSGIETLDYDACVEFANWSQGLDVAEQAVGATQSIYFQNKAIDNAANAAKNQATDATAGLKAQKNSFKDQQSIYEEKSAFDAGKLAVLLSKYNAMPSVEEAKSKCADIKSKRPEVGSLQQVCEAVVTRQIFNVLMNQKTKDQMKSILVKAGVDMTGNAMIAELAGQQANSVDGAIAGVNNFQASTTVADQIATTTFCKMNPTDAKCIGVAGQQGFASIGDSVINFGTGGAGTVYGGNSAIGGGGGSTTGTGTGTSATPSKTGLIGSAITAVDNSGTMEKVAGASITKGTAPGAGGGGGGGGSAGGGGGGGGGPAPGGAAAASNAIGSTKPLSYAGGGSSLSMMGGMGINKAKAVAKDNSNPFGSMFDKNKAGADKVLNFRGPASVGTKGDNIFDMISKRYVNVNADKRLMEYEEVTK